MSNTDLDFLDMVLHRLVSDEEVEESDLFECLNIVSKLKTEDQKFSYKKNKDELKKFNIIWPED